MKILQLIYSLSSGGAERFVVDLSNELYNRGNEVHLVVFRDEMKTGQDADFYRPLVIESINYHNLKIKEGFNLIAFVKVFKIIKSINPDIVHCHLNVIPYIFPVVLFNLRIKYFHTLHSLAPNFSGDKFQKPLNMKFYKSSKIKPITISRACDLSYQEYYNLNNAILIKNGRSKVNKTELFENVYQEVATYKTNKTTPVFIHVARFSKEKNQELLISSFNSLYEENFDFLLLIIGGGYDSVSGQELQNKACESIFFLGEKKIVNDYFLCSDAFCLTSEYEGLPISLLEALSAGCVPICTPVGGIIDVVSDGVTGYLSDNCSTFSYCKVLKRYIEDRSRISRQVLQNYFNANYSIKYCAEQHMIAYDENVF